MTTGALPAPSPLRTGPLPLPTPADVLALQRYRSYPAVSVLLSTTTGSVMTRTDAARLDAVVSQACRRLSDEFGAGAFLSLRRELGELAAQATRRATGPALALFVGHGCACSWRLPMPVQDRAVIDPTFATRDLVRGLHQRPDHAVLVLTERQARLFTSCGDDLTPAAGPFPLALPSRQGRNGQPIQRRRAACGEADSFLRTVDRALAEHLRQHPVPVVLVGAQRTVSDFLRLSHTTKRLAGIVTGSHVNTPLPVLAELVGPVVEHYLRFRHDQCLALLEQRINRGCAVTGMAPVWRAARHDHPEMLIIEVGLSYPARLLDGGTILRPADDITHPDVLDDAVDEVIEIVLERGGWVAFVDDGTLLAHERIALTLSRQ